MDIRIISRKAQRAYLPNLHRGGPEGRGEDRREHSYLHTSIKRIDKPAHGDSNNTSKYLSLCSPLGITLSRHRSFQAFLNRQNSGEKGMERNTCPRIRKRNVDVPRVSRSVDTSVEGKSRVEILGDMDRVLQCRDGNKRIHTLLERMETLASPDSVHTPLQKKILAEIKQWIFLGGRIHSGPLHILSKGREDIAHLLCNENMTVVEGLHSMVELYVQKVSSLESQISILREEIKERTAIEQRLQIEVNTLKTLLPKRTDELPQFRDRLALYSQQTLPDVLSLEVVQSSYLSNYALMLDRLEQYRGDILYLQGGIREYKEKIDALSSQCGMMGGLVEGIGVCRDEVGEYANRLYVLSDRILKGGEGYGGYGDEKVQGYVIPDNLRADILSIVETARLATDCMLRLNTEKVVN